jgi:molybdopterin molybdotransferase
MKHAPRSSPDGEWPADVRMRGFSQRSTVEAALAWVDGNAALLPSEPIELVQAVGRVLAESIASSVKVPSFARSMMDGYALRAADTDGASSYNRLPLRIVGQSLPGRPFDGLVQPGEAVTIMTGAPIPTGADAVLPVERCQREGDTLLALDSVPPQKHVGRAGEDIDIGAPLLSVGRLLRPQDIGALASIGLGRVHVVKRPRVRIIVTGNELLPVGSESAESKIIDSNGPMLSALVERDGGMPINPGIVPDDPEQIRAALESDAEVLLVSGGSSVGEEDHAPRLVADLGNLAIHGIAMRPSSPAGMGRIGEKLVFLLPGNPVSCLCSYDFFAGQAIRLLGGRRPGWPYRKRALPLARKLVSQVGRVDYARVRIVEGESEPLAISGASLLSSTVLADGFVVIPGDSEGFPPGTMVEVFLYDG